MEKNINESILDPVQKTRCEAVFDLKTEKMKPEVKKFIMDILEKFKADTRLNFKYTTVFMIGSSTGYQYSDTSDIDINARVSLPRSAFKGKFSFIPKGIILPNTQKPVNIFVSFADDDEYNPDYAENIYNILTDNWDKKSTLEKSEIPYSYVAGLSTFFMDGCELMFGKYERDKKELLKYMSFDPNKVSITEKEKDEAINRKIIDIQNDADALKMAHHFMFSFDNEGYSGSPFIVRINYQFKDPHYSMNNLIYKYIDSFGYYERINEIQKESRELVRQASAEIKKNSADKTVEGDNKKETQQEIQNKELKESRNSLKDSEEDNEQYIVINADGARSIAHSEEERARRQAEEDAKKKVNTKVNEGVDTSAQDSTVPTEEITNRASELHATDTRNNLQNPTATKQGNGNIVKTPDPENTILNANCEILLRNSGYQLTERNVNLLKKGLKSGKYVIVGGDYGNSLDEALALSLASSLEKSLNEDELLEDSLATKTEKYLDKRIMKTAGKWSPVLPDIADFLFSGPIGLIIAHLIVAHHNDKLDDIEAELYNEVKDDPECSEIISKIRDELNKPTPNKDLLKSLKNEYSVAVTRCHSRLKENKSLLNATPQGSLQNEE